jgi:hypothetical protein
MSRRTFQYASNLVMKLKQPNALVSRILDPQPTSWLVLLGNLGSPGSPKTSEFLEWSASNWTQILWIPGAVELASPSSYVRSWTQQLDCMRQVAESISSNISVATKLSIQTRSPDIQVVATSMWHPEMIKHSKRPIYHWNSTTMCHEQILDVRPLIQNEAMWVERQIKQSVSPVLLCSYGPSPSVLYPPKVLATLVGMDVCASLYPNRRRPFQAWQGLNSADSKGFHSNIQFEVSERSLTQKTVQRQLEETILKQLLDPKNA